jgi:restriction endonuclease S subunit
MRQRLEEIANIQPGYPFREGIEPADDGRLLVIQIKDIGSHGEVEPEGIVRVETDGIKPYFFVQPQDVLFTTRGTSRRAASVGDGFNDTIFVAQIFAIRSLAEHVLPEYLAWYLNQYPAQEHFETYTSGTTIQNVRKAVLAALPVDVPPVTTQQLVLKIAGLRRRENELRQALEEKRTILINESLLSATKA